MRSRPLLRLLPYAITIAAMAGWLALEDRTPTGITGWTLLTLLLLTTSAIVWTAASPRHPANAWLALASVGALGLIAALTSHVGILAALTEATLAISWSTLCCAAAWALRRWGPGLAACVPLLAAALCMALPVAAMPLVRAAGRWGTPGNIAWQNALVRTIAHACPFFPALSALRPAIKIDWGTLPGMYAWSGLGQEIPLELPNPWTCSALYTIAALCLLFLGRHRGSTRHADPSPPAPDAKK